MERNTLGVSLRAGPLPDGARGSTLWGGRSPKLRMAAALATAAAGMSLAPGSAMADQAYVSGSLLANAKANPSATFNVIVEASHGKNSANVSAAVAEAKQKQPGTSRGVKKSFTAIDGVSAQLTGAQLLALQGNSAVQAIVPDGKTHATGATWSNTQNWVQVSDATKYWGSGLQAPTIAIVDSGIDTSKAADFGARVVAQQTFVSSGVNSPGDGYGHGTLVAGLAAGAAPGYSGYAPNAKLVSLDVMDDSGAGTISDVVAAADWILANKAKYNIRVANFSLTGSMPASFMYDPLDQAVEKLWNSGVVVVAAAGNYAENGAPSGVLYAPGNDPFVITVGAADTNGTNGMSDDSVAPWSAWGYTPDGFAKPDVVAPGRYMNGPVPVTGQMYLQHPERIVAPGYMWMSGTSFASPVVAGAAAAILSKFPSWTPDQVKGAIMLTATPVGTSAAGVGEMKPGGIAWITNPPNPNAGLDQYLVADPNGGSVPVFDAAAWASAAWSSAAWNSAAWSSAAWSSAAWSSAAWSSAAWTSAAWASAAWTSGTVDGSSLPSGTGDVK